MRTAPDVPKHAIILLTGSRVVCACGTELHLSAKEAVMTKTRRYDALLDRHAVHRAAKEAMDR